MKSLKLKERLIYLVTKTILKPTPILPELLQKMSSIVIDEQQMNSINNTTNNVMVIDVEGSKIYFRPCRIHRKIQEYVFSLLEEFCSKIPAEDFKAGVFALLRQKRRFKCFVNMGMENDPSSGLARFQKTHDAELIGLTNDLYLKYSKEVDELARSAWGDLVAYKLNGGVGKNTYQTYNSGRCLATYAVANFFGLYSLIPKVEYSKLYIKDNNTWIVGTVMESAEGVSPAEVKPEDMREMLSPVLQKELMELNVMDVLCFQKDHRPDNFHIKIEDGKLTHVSAFDNDAPATFSFSKTVEFSTYIGCAPFVKDGLINRPHISKSIYEQLISAKGKALKEQLKPYINRFQMRGFIARLRKLQKAFIRTQKSNPYFVVEDDYWSEETICEELSGKYGVTYLGALLQDTWRK